MKTLVLTALPLLLIIIAPPLYATSLEAEMVLGGDKGNGGDAIVCFVSSKIRNIIAKRVRDMKPGKEDIDLLVDPLSGISESDIESVSLLDLNGLNYKYSKVDLQNSYNKILKDRSNLFGKSSLKRPFLYMLEHFTPENDNWVDASSGIIPVDDSNHDISFSNRCLLLQVAKQRKLNGSIYIKYDQRLFSMMDSINKAALVFHEWIYSFAPGLKDSTIIRRIIYLIFSLDSKNPEVEKIGEIESLLVSIVKERVSLDVYGGPGTIDIEGDEEDLKEFHFDGLTSKIYGYKYGDTFYGQSPIDISTDAHNSHFIYEQKVSGPGEKFLELGVHRYDIDMESNDEDFIKQYDNKLHTISTQDYSKELQVIWERGKGLPLVKLQGHSPFKRKIPGIIAVHETGVPKELFFVDGIAEILPNVYAGNVADYIADTTLFNVKGIGFYKSGEVAYFAVSDQKISILNNIELYKNTIVDLYENGNMKTVTPANEVFIDGHNFIPRSPIVFYESEHVRAGFVVDDFTYMGLSFLGMKPVEFYENSKVRQAWSKNQIVINNSSITIPEKAKLTLDPAGNIVETVHVSKGSSFKGQILSENRSVFFWEGSRVKTAQFKNDYKYKDSLTCVSSVTFYKDGELFHCNLNSVVTHSSGIRSYKYVYMYLDGSLMETRVVDNALGLDLDVDNNTVLGLYENGQLAYTKIRDGKYYLWRDLKVTRQVSLYNNGNLFSGYLFDNDVLIDGLRVQGKTAEKVYFHRNGQLQFAVSAVTQKYRGRWYFPGEEIWLDAIGNFTAQKIVADPDYLENSRPLFPGEGEWKRAYKEIVKKFKKLGFID